MSFPIWLKQPHTRQIDWHTATSNLFISSSRPSDVSWVRSELHATQPTNSASIPPWGKRTAEPPLAGLGHRTKENFPSASCLNPDGASVSTRGGFGGFGSSRSNQALEMDVSTFGRRCRARDQDETGWIMEFRSDGTFPSHRSCPHGIPETVASGRMSYTRNRL